jgi:hypothetical protein
MLDGFPGNRLLYEDDFCILFQDLLIFADVHLSILFEC